MHLHTFAVFVTIEHIVIRIVKAHHVRGRHVIVIRRYSLRFRWSVQSSWFFGKVLILIVRWHLNGRHVFIEIIDQMLIRIETEKVRVRLLVVLLSLWVLLAIDFMTRVCVLNVRLGIARS